MLCIVKTPIDLAMWVKLNNLIQKVSREPEGRVARNGKLVVEVLDRADLSAMVPGEKLTLIGHGNTTEFGGLTVDALAAKLITQGLRGKIHSIKLSGCSSGAGGEEESFSAHLARKLYDLTKSGESPLKIPVTGFTGTSVTDDEGRVRVKDRFAAVGEGPSYDEILAKYRGTGDLDLWLSSAKTLPWDNQEVIERSARSIAEASKGMFAELYRLNGQITFNKTDSKFKFTW